MKKIVCTLAALGVVASVQAQGLVNFANAATSQIRMKDPGQPDSAAVVMPANGGFVQLLWAPQGTAWTYSGGSLADYLTSSAWDAIPASIKAVGPAPGRFNAGEISVPTATPGAVIQAAVAAWRGSAASFDAAITEGQYTGISSSFVVDTGDPTTPIPELAASITGANQLGQVIVTVIPEPSSMALIGLGAAALLALRRRK